MDKWGVILKIIKILIVCILLIMMIGAVNAADNAVQNDTESIEDSPDASNVKSHNGDDSYLTQNETPTSDESALNSNGIENHEEVP